MAWLLPELDDGVLPELKPEFELEEPVLEFEFDEPVLDEPVPEEPVPEEPVPEEPEFDELLVPELAEPELVEPELDDVPVEVEAEAVLWVDPGRVRATMPAAATLAMVTVVVVVRTRDRPRSRSAAARRTRSRYSLLMTPILRSPTRSLLEETSPLAMRRVHQGPAATARLVAQHEGLVKPLTGR